MRKSRFTEEQMVEALREADRTTVAEAAKKTADAAKKASDEERSRVEDRNRELSADLSRVRIEKEQQRQELVAARERLRELGEAADQISDLKASAARAQEQARELAAKNESLNAAVREAQAAKPVAGPGRGRDAGAARGASVDAPAA